VLIKWLNQVLSKQKANSNQILKVNQETHKIETPTSFSWVDVSLGANENFLSKFHQNLRSQEEIPSKFYQIQTLEASRIFNSKLISNLRKFLYGKLLFSLNPSKPYFISKFLSSRRSCLDRIKFEWVRNNLKLFETVLNHLALWPDPRISHRLPCSGTPPPRTHCG
jgi:hypothetical protein